MPRRTALIVAVPEAEPHVAELRLAHDASLIEEEERDGRWRVRRRFPLG